METMEVQRSIKPAANEREKIMASLPNPANNNRTPISKDSVKRYGWPDTGKLARKYKMYSENCEFSQSSEIYE